jgi:hypothetical protein
MKEKLLKQIDSDLKLGLTTPEYATHLKWHIERIEKKEEKKRSVEYARLKSTIKSGICDSCGSPYRNCIC